MSDFYCSPCQTYDTRECIHVGAPLRCEQDVTRAMEEMRNHLARHAVPRHPCVTSYELRCRDLRDEFLRTAGQDVLADLARVALGMKVERR